MNEKKRAKVICNSRENQDNHIQEAPLNMKKIGRQKPQEINTFTKKDWANQSGNTK